MKAIRFMRLVPLLIFFLIFLTGVASAQVLEIFPANGSMNAPACGPFGIRVAPGTITDHDDVLVVRGLATGKRLAGQTVVSAAGDSLYFLPMLPFAPGEMVEITLRSGVLPQLGGRTWRAMVAPDPEFQASGIDNLAGQTLDLSRWFAPGNLEFLGWDWGDLDGDFDQDGVLLLGDGARFHLATVSWRRDLQAETAWWEVLSPTVVIADNPVAIDCVQLDGQLGQEVVLLTLAGLQIWNNPGTYESPVGGLANWLAFPAGFNARAMVSGDLDSDGDDDLVILGLFGQEYLILTNDGAGGLQAGAVTPAGPPAAPSMDKNLPWPVTADLADADGDGHADLIWAADFQEQGEYPVRVARGLGDGTFGTAGILSRETTFPRSLYFGRTLDPRDDVTSAAMVLITGHDAGIDNLCGIRFDGTWPGQTAGCLRGPGLTADSGPVSVSHILGSGGSLEPEIWYADPVSGRLTARVLSASGQVHMLDLGTGVAAVHAGDLDFDGDGDVAVLLQDQAALTILSVPGGASMAPPSSDETLCGEPIDFGVREAGCIRADAEAFLTFNNESLLPARITDAVLDDPSGAFSLGGVPDEWFGVGCSTENASVMLPIRFSPPDTLNYAGSLTVTMVWIGGGAAGTDSTLTCTYPLLGRGGRFGATDAGSGLGELGWNSENGYVTTGGTIDFGTLPAVSGVTAEAQFTLTNTGDFTLQITPPAGISPLWVLSPTGPRQLAPGQTETWILSANPTPEMVPTGLLVVDVADTFDWTLDALRSDQCLGTQTISQALSIELLAAEPCLAPDPGCTEMPDLACADLDTVFVTEESLFTYCLVVQGWDWPGVDPQMRIVSTTVPWMNLAWQSATETTPPRVNVSSLEAGPVGGTIVIEVRDNRYPVIARTFTLVVEVDPIRPDLVIVDMAALPGSPGEDLYQHRPFTIDVVVEARRESVTGAQVSLDGDKCFCGLIGSDKTLIDLEVGEQRTVTFTVEWCEEAGDCGFTACVEPPGGLQADFDPSNNCWNLAALVAPNAGPRIEYFNLSLDPADPDLEPCDPDVTLNQISDGQVEALGVREQNTLRFSARAVDLDGDPLRLTANSYPAFLQVTAVSDTVLDFVMNPPEGTVTDDFCQAFGELELIAGEFGIAFPETTTLATPLFVKWEGPDLSVRFTGIPSGAGLLETVTVAGEVACAGYDSGPFEVRMWLEDPDGFLLAETTSNFSGLNAGETAELTSILQQVVDPGRYCARIAITSGRDVDAGNNTAESCFTVDAGPFVVSPNVATPNGDGQNDEILFHFDNQTVDQPRLKVFELGGRNIYETTALDGQQRLVWNGADDTGRLVQPGTYLYVIYDGQTEFRSGTCGVVR